jgi:hypothetical protein
MPTTRQSKLRRQAALRKQKDKKAKGEQFRRRRINLGGKGVDLVELCGAKFYSVVERHGHIWEFNSESHHGSWPPSRHDLVSDFHSELLPPLLTRKP